MGTSRLGKQHIKLIIPLIQIKCQGRKIPAEKSMAEKSLNHPNQSNCWPSVEWFFLYPSISEFFLKMDHSRTLFLHFHLFNTVDSKQIFNIKVCWWLYLNRRSLKLEASALPTEPQPLPKSNVIVCQISARVCGCSKVKASGQKFLKGTHVYYNGNHNQRYWEQFFKQG